MDEQQRNEQQRYVPVFDERQFHDELLNMDQYWHSLHNLVENFKNDISMLGLIPSEHAMKMVK